MVFFSGVPQKHSCFDSIVLPRCLLEVSSEINHAGGKCCLVGGWVRDQLLGITAKDYDIEVYGISEHTLLSILNKYGTPNVVGRSFGVIVQRMGGRNYDFAFPRTESKVGKGHKGFLVAPNPDLTFEQASARRDFTINAMGVLLPEIVLLDAHNGVRDLQNKELRHVGSAFGEDPLRALRGVQFASRFDFTIHPHTLQICREQPLQELSSERFLDEFSKWLLQSPRPSVGMQWFWKMQMERFFPELDVVHLVHENAQHTHLQAFCPQTVSELQSFICAMLDCDVLSKQPYSYKESLSIMLYLLGSHLSRVLLERFIQRVTRDNDIWQLVAKLYGAVQEAWNRVCQHQELNIVDLRFIAVHLPLRLSLAVLCTVLHLQAYTHLEQLAQNANIWEHSPQPWLTGRDLLGIGFKPGPQMGAIIQKSFEMQLEGNFRNGKDAKQWAMQQLVAE
jgi:tRNA nucleotidyltransferase (CCA-adding enzyme)